MSPLGAVIVLIAAGIRGGYRWTLNTVRLLNRYEPVESRTRQVLCPGSGVNPEMHEFWITRGYACPSCKAAL